MDYAPLRFGILGPLEVRGPAGLIPIRRPLHRAALAALLLEHDAPYQAASLAMSLWGDDLPAGWRDSLRTCIYGLRNALSCGRERLVTIPGGWMIRLLPGELDLDDFRLLAGQGREAMDRGDCAAAIDQLTKAVKLWRTPPLADLPDGARDWIASLYRGVRADTAQARLEAGHSYEMLTGLRELVHEDPGDERAWAQLMTALARCGKRAEALACYQQARSELRQSYGIEPGPQLRDLQNRILADELLPGALPGDDWLRACQLPAVPADFTGRVAEISELTSPASSAGVAVRVVHGPPGAGKTTLAARAAWLAAASYPGGQIFVRIGGGQPEEPADILVRVMRSLGVPMTRIPPSGWEREAMYRSVLGGRPALVVADNASTAEQVRALLPGAPGSSVIVTAPGPIGGVDGALHLPLAGLSDIDSIRLLATIAGPGRVSAEPDAARDICEACAWMPGSIRSAGNVLAAHAEMTLRRMANSMSTIGTSHAMADITT